jgi:hypothetical protein
MHKQGDTIICNIMCFIKHQSECQNTIMIHDSTVCDGFVSPNHEYQGKTVTILGITTVSLSFASHIYFNRK